MAASFAKFWVGFLKKKFVWIGQASKANLLIPWWLEVMLLLPKKIKKKQNYKDQSQIEYYSYNKRDYYITKFLEK